MATLARTALQLARETDFAKPDRHIDFMALMDAELAALRTLEDEAHALPEGEVVGALANYNTIVTPERGLLCSIDEAREIRELLEASEDGTCHGFQFVRERDGEGFLEADESGLIDEVPEAVFEKMGTLIARAGLPYLEFWAAFTCSKMAPGSHGGTAFRIYPDGRLVSRIETWPDDPEPSDPDRDGFYADVRWSPDDVASHREDLTTEQCEAFLRRNADRIRDRLVELGNDFIGDLLAFDEQVPKRPEA